MSPQSRRTFTAAAVAIASLGAGSVIAQDASPVADLPSARTLDTWLTDVISRGNLRIIPELIDDSTDKADEFFLTMLDVATGIRGDTEGEIPLVRKMVHVEPDRAIVLVDLGETPDSFAFFYLEFMPESGLVHQINAAWHTY